MIIKKSVVVCALVMAIVCVLNFDESLVTDDRLFLTQQDVSGLSSDLSFVDINLNQNAIEGSITKLLAALLPKYSNSGITADDILYIDDPLKLLEKHSRESSSLGTESEIYLYGCIPDSNKVCHYKINRSSGQVFTKDNNTDQTVENETYYVTIQFDSRSFRKSDEKYFKLDFTKVLVEGKESIDHLKQLRNALFYYRQGSINEEPFVFEHEKDLKTLIHEKIAIIKSICLLINSRTTRLTSALGGGSVVHDAIVDNDTFTSTHVLLADPDDILTSNGDRQTRELSLDYILQGGKSSITSGQFVRGIVKKDLNVINSATSVRVIKAGNMLKSTPKECQGSSEFPTKVEAATYVFESGIVEVMVVQLISVSEQLNITESNVSSSELIQTESRGIFSTSILPLDDSEVGSNPKNHLLQLLTTMEDGNKVGKKSLIQTKLLIGSLLRSDVRQVATEYLKAEYKHHHFPILIQGFVAASRHDRSIHSELISIMKHHQSSPNIIYAMLDKIFWMRSSSPSLLQTVYSLTAHNDDGLRHKAMLTLGSLMTTSKHSVDTTLVTNQFLDDMTMRLQFKCFY